MLISGDFNGSKCLFKINFIISCNVDEEFLIKLTDCRLSSGGAGVVLFWKNQEPREVSWPETMDQITQF